MKPWLLIVLGVVLPALVGCRTDPAIPLLERELYRKDKEINRLKWQIEDMQDLLNSGQERSVGRDKAGEDREPDAGSRRSRRGSNGNGVKPPVTERGTPTDKVPDTLKSPGGTLPAEVPEVPENIRGPSSNRSSSDGPMLEEGPDGLPMRPVSYTTPAAAAATAVPFRPSGDSRWVASIELDRMFTGGINSGDRSGDQGLLVVVEPRDAAGRPVDAPGEVNVAVLDPAYQGDAARVARWNFTAAETAGLFRRTSAGGAMHLAMAWPATPPKHNKLHLFVRYVTSDGRKFEANQPIEIALPGQRPARWTAAEPARTANPPAERPPASRSWSQGETPPARLPDPPPRTATRTSASNPERPVWSPDRR